MRNHTAKFQNHDCRRGQDNYLQLAGTALVALSPLQTVDPVARLEPGISQVYGEPMDQTR